MRLALVGLLALLSLWRPGGARADDEPGAGMSDEERARVTAQVEHLRDQVGALLSAGKFSDAVPLQEQVADLRQGLLGLDHPEYLRSESVLALLREASSMLDEASGAERNPVAELELAIQLGGTATRLVHEGFHVGALRLHERARPFLERALNPVRLRNAEERLAAGTAWSNLGVALQSAGSLGAARALYDRALPLCEAGQSGGPAMVATVLSNLGTLLHELGEYAEAHRHTERANLMVLRIFGPEHPYVVQGAMNLAALLLDEGRLDEAEAQVQASLRLARRIPSYPVAELAKAFQNLGWIRTARGEEEQALAVFTEALRMSERALGAEHPALLEVLSGLAGTLERQGLQDEARPLRERALAIMERSLGPDHPAVAGALREVAIHVARGPAPAAALPLLERARRIQERALGADNPALSPTLSSLGLLLRDLGRSDEAQAAFERALHINEAGKGPRHPAVAVSLSNLALVFIDRERWKEARAALERAQAITDSTPDATAEDSLAILVNLGALHHMSGDHAGARPLTLAALKRTAETLRGSLLGRPVAQRVSALRLARRRLDDWILLTAALGESGYPEVLEVKGLAARTLAAEHRLLRQGGPQVAGLVDAVQASSSRVARLAEQAPDAAEGESLGAWRRRYALAASDLEQSEAALKTLRAGTGGAAPEGAGWEAVQRGLRPQDCVVDLLNCRGQFVAWIVRPQGDVLRVHLGSAEDIERAAAAFIQASRGRGGLGRGLPLPSQAPSQPAAEDAGAALRRLVWDPLRAHMGADVREVVLCPDDVLAAVPWAALPDASGAPLGQHLLLRHVTMVQDLVPSAAPAPAGQGALLVGGVDYEHADQAAGEPSSAATAGGRALQRAPRGAPLTPLPETGAEVQALKDALGPGAQVLAASGATEARVRAAARGMALLHLATHGFVREDLLRRQQAQPRAQAWLPGDLERHLGVGTDPMLLAGLALAGANPRSGGGGDDGILTAAEVAYMDLDGVDLVVLSACETASGTPEGGQGVLGLVQAFRIAGAQQVLGSLWPVDDEATRILMVEFHRLRRGQEGRAGLGAADALQQAQLHLRSLERVRPDGTKERPFEAPSYWASWVLWGRAR